MFTTALCTIANVWNQLRCPTRDEWIKKWSHTHSGMFATFKNKEILPFAQLLMTWMQNKSVTGRQILRSKNNQTHRSRERMVIARAWGKREMIAVLQWL